MDRVRLPAGGPEVIELTPEMRAAFLAEHEDTCDAVGCGRQACLDVRLAAVLPIAERDLVARVEGKRDTGLCDCACDSEPTNPRTGKPMEHHCDCRAVTTAGVLLGDRRKTRHVAECTCDWDEP
jgi:hypothetical protein